MDTALDKFASIVRQAREQQGLSQRELASRLNMNTRTIIDLEVGRSNPKAETIFLIAAELHISLDSMIYSQEALPNAVSIEVLDFFSGKTREEAKHYIRLCQEVAAISAQKAPEQTF
ncbi:helix-turn-helix domain-containing protein [Dysosmobacter sp.]